MSEPPAPEPVEDERTRQRNNLVLLTVFVLLVAGGVWIVNVMLDLRKAQDCASSGRRNCTPITTPVNPR